MKKSAGRTVESIPSTSVSQIQMLHDGPHPGKSSIEFLAMIDLDPCNPTCIYSTLKFVVSQARLYDVTPYS